MTSPLTRILATADRRTGRVTPTTGTHRSTPWVSRSDDGIYLGLDGSAWLYRVLENAPLQFSDPDDQLHHGRKIGLILADIGSSSIPAAAGGPLANTGQYRDIHIATIRWTIQPEAPRGTHTKRHADYLNREVLNQFTAPAQAVFIGVRLSDLDTLAASRSRSPFDFAKSLINDLFQDTTPKDGIARYTRDIDFLHGILTRHGCRTPQPHELRQLQAWFNHGSTSEPEIIAHPDHLLIGRNDRLEFAALEQFNTPSFAAPGSEWIAAVLDHDDGPATISIRTQLQPAVDTRRDLRKSIRLREQADQERVKANQTERIEESEDYELTRMAEANYSRGDSRPSLRNTSIIFGRRDNGYTHETYVDYLRDTFSIDVKPLTHRQMWALEETLPCAQKRANPFPQHLNLEMAAYAGLGIFTELGDPDGAYVGRGLPDGTPVYFDPLAFNNHRNNMPPATFIAGIPGSGKLVVLPTKVPTPSGWTTMGALREGDVVLDRAGRHCRVVYLSPVDPEPELYDVVFDDGQVVRACVDHQWVVSDRMSRLAPGRPKCGAPAVNWDRRVASAETLERKALRYGPDESATTQELLDLLRRSSADVPWRTHIAVYTALEEAGCPSEFVVREVEVGGYQRVEADKPAVLLPVAEVLRACAAAWREAKGPWAVQRAARVKAAEALLGEVEVGAMAPQAEIARLLMGAGAPISGTLKQFSLQIGKVRKAAGIEAVEGRATVVTEATSGYAQAKERRVWPVRTALKSLAALLRERAGERPSLVVEERVLTTGQMLSEGVRLVSDSEDRANFAVRVAAPMQLPDADLPVDPYVLGAWLGDGCGTTGNSLYSGVAESCTDEHGRTDQEAMLRELHAAGVDASISGTNPELRICIRGLRPGFRAAGVLGDKHIPMVYLRGSVEQRLALLQGLMDTDGHIDENGHCELSLTNKRLIDGALELVRGLGIKASMAESDAVIVEDDPDRPGEKRRRVTGRRWRIHFTTTQPVFRLPRKAARLPESVRDTTQWLYIVDMVPVAPEPGRCIQVDSPDHTYQVAGHIVTHNTFLAQSLSFQAALSGLPVSFINPKGQESLYPMVELMQDWGVETEWVAISRLAQDGGEGTFDPFRYARTPETAAMLASNIVLTVLSELSEEQRIALRHGLTLGAKGGARTTLEALRYVNDEYVQRIVMSLWESSPMFQLCVGKAPRPRMVGDMLAERGDGTGKFMLTEFDVDLSLPSTVKLHYEDAERTGLAIMRAVTMANIGMLAGGIGGMFVVDEAHNVLGHPETISVISRIMREGRSQGVAQVYLSQLVSDLLNVGAAGSSLESYVSRAFALKMNDEREAAAALRLVGYEPTRERIEQMTDFGPKRTEAGMQPAYGYFRDLYGRRSLVSLGPVGASFAAAASTNMSDRIARERAQGGR